MPNLQLTFSTGIALQGQEHGIHRAQYYLWLQARQVRVLQHVLADKERLLYPGVSSATVRSITALRRNLRHTEAQEVA